MTSDGVLVVKCVFETILTLTNSWYIPGTHTTPFEFAVFSLAFLLAIRVIRMVVSLQSGGEDH